MDDIEINKAFVIGRLKRIVGGGEGRGDAPRFCTQAAHSLLRMGVRESLPTSQTRGAFFSKCLGHSLRKAVGKGTIIYQEPTKC